MLSQCISGQSHLQHLAMYGLDGVNDSSAFKILQAISQNSDLTYLDLRMTKSWFASEANVEMLC